MGHGGLVWGKADLYGLVQGKVDFCGASVEEDRFLWAKVG